MPLSPTLHRRLQSARRMLVCDIDETLVAVAAGHPGKDALELLLRERADEFVFVVATGRNLSLIHEVLDEHEVPEPDILVASVGTELYYGKAEPERDVEYEKWMNWRWQRDKLEARLRELTWLKLQPDEHQNPFKLSYLCAPENAYRDGDVMRHLGGLASECQLVWSHGRYLDVLPLRSAKGGALRYLAKRWGFDLAASVSAGDSGNDRTMLQGETLGIVVAGYVPELEDLRGRPRVYFATGAGPEGIMEGLRFHGFIDSSRASGAALPPRKEDRDA